MTGGVVLGGWEFVIAAYTLTTVVLAIYGGSVFRRLGKEQRRGPTAAGEEHR